MFAQYVYVFGFALQINAAKFFPANRTAIPELFLLAIHSNYTIFARLLQAYHLDLKFLFPYAGYFPFLVFGFKPVF